MTVIEELERIVAILNQRIVNRDSVLPDSAFFSSMNEAITIIEQRINHLKKENKKNV